MRAGEPSETFSLHTTEASRMAWKGTPMRSIQVSVATAVPWVSLRPKTTISLGVRAARVLAKRTSTSSAR